MLTGKLLGFLIPSGKPFGVFNAAIDLPFLKFKTTKSPSVKAYSNTNFAKALATIMHPMKISKYTLYPPCKNTF